MSARLPRIVWSAPLAAALLCGAAPGDFGASAPLVEVDRFSDAAATRLRRSAVKGLPGPNRPIDLDAAPFVVAVEGPDGKRMQCYDLDDRPATPAPYYVFYDRAGTYELGQFPVIDVAPGDPGYTDIWDIWKVIVPESFVADNSIRDMLTVRRLLADSSSGYSAIRTGILLNGPIVPEGSSAGLKADRRGGRAALMHAWYRGRRAPYLYFEGSLRAEGDLAPTSEMTVPARGDSDWSALASLSHLANEGPLRVKALPGQPAYSPLQRIVSRSGGAESSRIVNCPIVGP